MALTKKQQRVVKLAQAGGTSKELAILKEIFDLEDKFDATVADIKASVPSVKTMLGHVTELKGEAGDKGETGETGESIVGPQGEQGTPGRDGIDGRSVVGPAGRDGSDGKNGIDGAPGIPGKDGSPDTPRQIKDKLLSLTDEEKLAVKDIQGLPDVLDGLSKRASGRVQTPAKAFMVRRTDLTSLCNGVLKTFNVGTHFGIIGVFGTEFPQVYRPLIDYTETAQGFTLTAAVSAPATGQTLIVQFLK